MRSLRIPFQYKQCYFDFSENYNRVSQDEIQNAHWTNLKHVYLCKVYQFGTIHLIKIASDDLSHYKDIVIPYISRTLYEVPKKI